MFRLTAVNITSVFSRHLSSSVFPLVNGVLVSLQETEFDVQGLYENNEYMFRVAAVNENGCGEWLEAESPIVAKLSFGKIVHQNNTLHISSKY